MQATISDDRPVIAGFEKQSGRSTPQSRLSVYLQVLSIKQTLEQLTGAV